ncbi:MAG: hypothetical protein DWQ04_33760 [Chloroflexi bacterium]|nr:MAG: hypothetical protein DWQ04_33760 [Chloroflexota bacterium]
MSEETNESQTPRRAIGWILVILLLLFLILGATALLSGNNLRPIKPFVATETAVPVNYNAPFEPVSFPDLQANPEQYRDQRIRVTGRFTRLTPPDCVSFDGPVIRWGLIAEDLQMNAQGLESLLHLIPADTTLTVDGVWQRYQGPSGCGKEPEMASVWYLVVSRIVQPNPLPLPGTSPVDSGAQGTVATMTATAVSGEPPELTPTVNDETAVTLTPPTATPTQSPTNTPPGFPTSAPVDATPTLRPTTQPTASPTTVSGNQPTATTGAPAGTATVTHTATETTTPDPNATATPGNGSQPPIGLPTATPQEVTPPAYPPPGTPAYP